MHKLSNMSRQQMDEIKIILTDIDDTITTDGSLKSSSYSAIERLSDAGYIVIPVTGRCAGWCDHIARMWPVNGVVGENGAFFFSYNHQSKKMLHTYSQSEKERTDNKKTLQKIKKIVLDTIPGSALASDQDYRKTDLAIDFAEDVPRLSTSNIKEIVNIAIKAGATAKVSSIHVNCWIGNHNKLNTTIKTLQQNFGMIDSDLQKKVLFIGDSPNDSMMFGYFDQSVGVANVRDFMDEIDELPKYITSHHSGEGFVELANYLLNK